MEKGFFITLEGPEGSGKSSQGRWLVRSLRKAGSPAVFLRDPGSTALGRTLREMLLQTSVPLSALAEALLFIGGRVQLVEQVIRPALAKGHVVVCDRFHESTVAYQGFGGGLDVRWLNRMGRAAIHGVMPSLTILLDLPTAAGFRRLQHRRDRMERKARQFHQRVRNGFLQLARREPHRFVVVDASRSAASVHMQIEHIVMQHLRHRSVAAPWGQTPSVKLSLGV